MFSQDFKKCQISKFKTLLKQSLMYYVVIMSSQNFTRSMFELVYQINEIGHFLWIRTTLDMVIDRKHWGLIQQQPLPQLQVKGSLNYLMVIKRRRIAIIWSTTIHMVSTIFILYPVLLCCYQTCAAGDTIRQNDPISDGDGETLLSAGKTFELGFFTPNGSSSHQRYVGTWYYRLEPKTVVWVANRNDPLPDSTGVLSIQDGNLVWTFYDNKLGGGAISLGMAEKLWHAYEIFDLGLFTLVGALTMGNI